MFILSQIFPFISFSQVIGPWVNRTFDDSRIYNNLSIPGASIRNLFIEDTTGSNPFFQLILRGRGNMVDQIEQVSPEMLILWLGINEISPALTFGITWVGLTITPFDVFRTNFQAGFERLRAATRGPMIIIDIPDITLTPSCHFLSPFVPDPTTGRPILDAQGNPVPLLGQDGEPMDPETCVFKKALPYILEGYGVPVEYGGLGIGLPNEVIFSVKEINFLRHYIEGYNDIIHDIVGSVPNTYIFPVSKLFEKWSASKTVIGGIPIGFDFPFGGFWSYDTRHPSPIGHALIANELIKFLNDTLGTDLPPVNLFPILFGRECAVPQFPLNQISLSQISLSVGETWIPR